MDPPVGAQAFRYEPLDTSKPQIRLIKLLPQAITSWQTVIDCHVFHTSLEDNPSYEALSYVWGNESKPFMIRANGKALAVTTNLFTALLHLRGPQARTLWIDAICINQNSTSERNHQVAMMRSVFSRATQTSVWLGEIEFVVTNGSASFVHRIQSDYESSLQRAVDIRLLLDPYDEHAVENTHRILRSKWFYRVWVVQELACSKDVMIRVGYETMSWAALIRWAKIINRRKSNHDHQVTHAAEIASDKNSNDPIDDVTEEGEEPQYLDNYPNILTLDHQRTQYQRGARSDVLCLMFDLHEFEATIALDKIYALFGMAAQHDDSRLNLPVDYDIEFDELLGRVITQHTRLRRFCQIDPTRTMLQESLDVVMSLVGHTYHWTCRWKPPFVKFWPLASPIGRHNLIQGCLICRCPSPFGWLEFVYLDPFPCWTAEREADPTLLSTLATFFVVVLESGDVYKYIQAFPTTRELLQARGGSISTYISQGESEHYHGPDGRFLRQDYKCWRREAIPRMFASPSSSILKLLNYRPAVAIWKFLMRAPVWEVLDEPDAKERRDLDFVLEPRFSALTIAERQLHAQQD